MFKQSNYKASKPKGQSNFTKTMGDGKTVIAKTATGMKQMSYGKRVASQGLSIVDTIDMQIAKAIKG